MSDGHSYTTRVTHAADRELDGILSNPGAALLGSHRTLMRTAKLAVACFLNPDSRHHDEPGARDKAVELVRELQSRQTESGLFRGGDNTDSPPDSSFTINDVCDAHELIRRSPNAGIDLHQLRLLLEEIALNAEHALLTGGVHTPNHRWEISAALARLHRLRPSTALVGRVDEWLSEQIDIDADGNFSERSANYAAYVTDPALTAIADILPRPFLYDVVERNLCSIIGLTLIDDTIETIHSRRQDQFGPFSIAPFEMLYRRYAIATRRADFSRMAYRASRHTVDDAAAALAEVSLAPEIAGALPKPESSPTETIRLWPESSLSIRTSSQCSVVTYAGSDYPSFRRIRSGLANNPTFLRVITPSAVLDSVRLSRNFFGLGPFRPSGLYPCPTGNGQLFTLSESVDASYYQPLAATDRSRTGHYDLTDDGRFYGSMSFTDREQDVLTLSTRVTVESTDTGANLDVMIDGPETAWTLDLCFREGGEFDGCRTLGDGNVLVSQEKGRYTVGGTAIEFCTSAPHSEIPPEYRPGDDYAFLGATDQPSGNHAYLTGTTPCSFRVSVNVV